MTEANPYTPADGPVPMDDGAAEGVLGREIPTISLEASDGVWRFLPKLFTGHVVVFVYPATGLPGRDPIPGWEEIPGAIGCTVQAIGFRNHQKDIRALGWEVIGLSVQPSIEQREFASRVRIPYLLLSDPNLVLEVRLGLPTFSGAGCTFYRRLALLVESRHVTWVDYPVFPPQDSAMRVLTRLRTYQVREHRH